VENVREMIVHCLNELKADGIYHPREGCACLKEDLEPCGNITLDCEPGWRRTCEECWNWFLVGYSDDIGTRKCPACRGLL